MIRSPLAAITRQPVNKSPVPLAPAFRSWLGGLGWTGGGTATDETLMSTYGAVGTVFTIVFRSAEAQAGVQWKLYTKARSGKKEDRTEIGEMDHPALAVWNTPNPFMSRESFVERAWQHLLLTGETDWLVGRIGSSRTGMPIELWPVRPDRVEPVPHEDKFLDGYIYRSPDGQQIPLETQQVVSTMLPNPWDPYRGLGPVQSILIDIESAKYSAEWNRNFFLNSAQPGGIIQIEERLSDERFNEMTTRWAEQHKGINNAHRVAIIEQGTWVDRGFNMRDMQFAEMRGISSERVREGFGYPKPMLGAVDDVNRANAEAGEYVFAKWIVEQGAKRLRGTLNNKFLPLFGKDENKRFEFDFESPVEPDAERETNALSAKVNALARLMGAGFDHQEAAEWLEIPLTKWTKPEPMFKPGGGGPPEDDDDKDAVKKKDDKKKADPK